MRRYKNSFALYALKNNLLNTSLMIAARDSIISEIVAKDYRTADVFKKHGINFCCSGLISLDEACKNRNLEFDVVKKDIETVTRVVTVPHRLRFDEMKLDFLIDYVLNIHHGYLKICLPDLEMSLENFIEGHKKKFPELLQIQEIFRELLRQIHTHSLHEEEIIFPYIRQIVMAHRRKEPYAHLFVRTLRKPLSNIEKEHSNIKDLLNQLKTSSNGFSFPKNACTNHQVIYHKMQEFYNDMVQHKYLETEILFPKAIEIEQQLLQV